MQASSFGDDLQNPGRQPLIERQFLARDDDTTFQHLILRTAQESDYLKSPSYIKKKNKKQAKRWAMSSSEWTLHAKALYLN